MATSISKPKLIRAFGLSLLTAIFACLWLIYPAFALKRSFRTEPDSLFAMFLESAVFPAGNPPGVARSTMEYEVVNDDNSSRYFKYARFRTTHHPEELRALYDTYLKQRGYAFAGVESEPNLYRVKFINRESHWSCSIIVLLRAGENEVLVAHDPLR